ncbi:hypothetical protein Y886_18715 [Xanthomonas hyacinthi DSM 19077]|nr:hypothetical protein Y886_18715 [Xanthomonas hyacinthi DSM 19077]
MMAAYGQPAQADASAVEPSRTVDASPHLIAVTDIPLTLAATGGNPAGWDVPASLQGRPPGDATHDDIPLAAWVSSAALGDPALRTEVRNMLGRGIAVLVTSRPGETRHELATFGVEAMGRTAIYRHTDDGYSVTSVTEALDDPDAAESWQHASDAVYTAMLSSASLEQDAVPADGQGERAFLRIDDQTFSKHGRSASQTIRIMRDTTPSHDYKVIAVEAAVNVIPHANGILKRHDDDGLTPYFEPHGEGFFLYAPEAYRSTTLLQWKDTSPGARLLQAVPKSSGATHRKITEEISSKSTFTASVSPDVQSGLNKDGISAQGKVPFSLAWASESSERSGVEMSVEDYSVAVSAQTYPWGLASTWTFPLSNDISGNPDYFGSKKLSTRTMTPMMRRASLETASEWRIDGNYEQTVLVATRGTVENRTFMWTGVRNDPKRRPYVRLDTASRDVLEVEKNGFPWEDGVDKKRYEGGDIQPWVASKIDLSSPYLTRSATILIQSLSALGECLQADGGAVGLAACNKGKRSQQWMDSGSRQHLSQPRGWRLPHDGYARWKREHGPLPSPCTQPAVEMVRRSHSFHVRGG